jgi:hypothetical protein
MKVGYSGDLVPRNVTIHVLAEQRDIRVSTSVNFESKGMMPVLLFTMTAQSGAVLEKVASMSVLVDSFLFIWPNTTKSFFIWGPGTAWIPNASFPILSPQHTEATYSLNLTNLVRDSQSAFVTHSSLRVDPGDVVARGVARVDFVVRDGVGSISGVDRESRYLKMTFVCSARGTVVEVDVVASEGDSLRAILGESEMNPDAPFHAEGRFTVTSNEAKTLYASWQVPIPPPFLVYQLNPVQLIAVIALGTPLGILVDELVRKVRSATSNRKTTDATEAEMPVETTKATTEAPIRAREAPAEPSA